MTGSQNNAFECRTLCSAGVAVCLLSVRAVLRPVIVPPAEVEGVHMAVRSCHCEPGRFAEELPRVL
eukprot:6626384-Heterocapsa_arctica.AAC.1